MTLEGRKKKSDCLWVLLAISHPKFLNIPHLSKWPRYPSGQQETLTPLSSGPICHQLLSIQPPVQHLNPSIVFSLLRPCQVIITSHLGLCFMYDLAPVTFFASFFSPFAHQLFKTVILNYSEVFSGVVSWHLSHTGLRQTVPSA